MTLKPLKLLLKKTLLRGILESHAAYRPSSLSSFIKLSLNIHSLFRNVLVKSDFMAVWQRPQKPYANYAYPVHLIVNLKYEKVVQVQYKVNFY